jgi:hypothetical protein
MLKIIIFVLFLIGSSVLVTNAFSQIEIEIQKEDERIREQLGWLIPEQHTLQEQIELVIDMQNSKYRTSIGFLSVNPNDIRLPENVESIGSDPRIISFTLTNQFGCAPEKIDRACVIIEVYREGLGEEILEIRENARKITDDIATSTFIFGTAVEFDSTLVKEKNMSDQSEPISIVEVVYTINKQPTHVLFTALTNMLLSTEIRESGGFYNHALKFSENEFSDFTISLIPLENKLLRALQVSLICSDKIPELVRCPGNITEQVSSGYISPIDIIQTENLNRSKIFEGDFYPLNSIVRVLIFSEQNLQVKSVNSNLIDGFKNLGDVQGNGWFFSSESGNVIDGRYIFGPDSTITRDKLAFTIGTNSEDDIQINTNEENGGCLIATAAFGSEMAPQVQLLREIRDNTVLQTESGAAFMAGFNQFYYSFSPVIADYERENSSFKEIVKLSLTPLLISLTLLQYADIDSESEMLGYGIGVILLNIGMYFVAPAVLIMKIKKRI